MQNICYIHRHQSCFTLKTDWNLNFVMNRYIYLMKSSVRSLECQNLLSPSFLDGNKTNWRCHWIYFRAKWLCFVALYYGFESLRLSLWNTSHIVYCFAPTYYMFIPSFYLIMLCFKDDVFEAYMWNYVMFFLLEEKMLYSIFRTECSNILA